ncbi:hypothetical protein CAPTEDRAFT_192072 [Capitella teleta]|uniref:Reverse transcriptase domain-containing protein n=1 Tax=Capitella teleta TaxID=283909 RepID=R7U0P5_CAPTE|nr:hypothetical protein CAPTEDRAFT_192072 [Capitella teleta]|eukprot:ELT96765.1 hypothetical protein CAPTEDRAFT_192072 [Capitella teleta]
MFDSHEVKWVHAERNISENSIQESDKIRAGNIAPSLETNRGAEKPALDKSQQAFRNPSYQGTELSVIVLAMQRKYNWDELLANTDAQINNEKITDKDLIADSFNKYFVDVGPSLAAKIPNHDHAPEDYLNGSHPHTIFLVPSTEIEVYNCLIKLKSSSSPGYDGLKSQIIKTVARELCIPLMHVINLCFTSGIVPFEFKLAIITPVYKGGDQSQFQSLIQICRLKVATHGKRVAIFSRLLRQDTLGLFFPETHTGPMC